MKFHSAYSHQSASRAISILCVALVFVFALTTNAVAQEDEDPSGEAIALFNKGQDAHEKGELPTAIDNYEKALKIVPDFPEAELQRGNAYQSLGKLDTAESAFRRAVELREDWSLALANLGSILVRRNSYTEAEKYLTKAVELDELNFPAYVAMTELRLQTNSAPKTLEELLVKLRVLTAKVNPTSSIWASRAALEVAVGDRKSAKVSASRALEFDPKSKTALSTSADIALAENDPGAADALVRRIEAIAPQAEATKRLRARVLVSQGKAAEALALINSIPTPDTQTTHVKNQLIAASSTNTGELEAQLATDPRNAIALTKLCATFRASDPAKALDYCRRASEASPNDVQPVIGYGAALVQAKRYADAVTILRRLVSIAPNNSTARANLATALFQLKKYPEAKAEFRWLTDNQPDQPAAFYFLGIVHDQLLEFTDAAANYQQFLRLADPESSKLEIEKVNLRLPVIYNLLKEGKGKKRG